MSSVFFGVGKRGKAAKQSIDQLYQYLLRATAHAPAVDAQLEGHRIAMSDQAVIGNVRARRTIALGVVILAVGVIVTVVTYAVAAPGGTYIVAWGAIIGGLVVLARGATQRTTTKRSR